MAYKLISTFTKEDLIESFSQACTYEEFMNIYKILSDAYGNWNIDLEICSKLVDIVYEGYIKRNTNDSLPNNLEFLRYKALVEQIESSKKEINIDDLEPLELLSHRYAEEAVHKYYSSYWDIRYAFEEGYEANNNSNNKALSDYTNEELLQELLKRK